MATNNPTRDGIETEQEWRNTMGARAVYEMNAIFEALTATESDGHIDPDLWRGSRLRLDTLVAVTLAALGTVENGTSEFMADALYGPGRWRR